MKKRLLALFLVFCAASSLMACGKKQENTTNKIEIVGEETKEEATTDEKTEDEDKKQEDTKIEIVEEVNVFNTWMTEDETTILNIQSDASNGDAIVGDCFTLLSPTVSKFTTCQVQADRLEIDSQNFYLYSVADNKLSISIDGTDYVFVIASPEKYDELYQSFDKSIISGLEIPQEEVLDNSSLIGSWQSNDGLHAYQITEDSFSYVAYNVSGLSTYTKESKSNQLVLDTGEIISYTLKDGSLSFTDPFTNETVTCKKILNTQYKTVKNDVYFGR